MLPMSDLIPCLVLGVIGGILGGMLGIGGGLIFIPTLALIFGGGDRQHLHQAAVMMVNLAVALASVIRHSRAGAVRTDILKGLFMGAVVFIGIGVYVGNFFSGITLSRIFAAFLVYVIYVNVRKLLVEFNLRESKSAMDRAFDGSDENITLTRTTGIGTVMGFFAGLLGIGGGGIAVPLQQVFLRVPLKQCVGTSAAAICLTSGVGAILKNMSLPEHGFEFGESLTLATALIPGAMVGGFFGAMLTHKLPTRWVRLVWTVFITAAGVKMAMG